VFPIFLAAYRDRDHVEAATSSKLTIGTGDQDDAIALAPASNVTATDLEVSEIAVPRHRRQRLVRSHTLKIHGCINSLRSNRKRETRGLGASDLFLAGNSKEDHQRYDQH